MPALTKPEAAEKLAKVAEKARPGVLAEIYAELFPEVPSLAVPVASDLAQRKIIISRQYHCAANALRLVCLGFASIGNA